LPAVSPRLISLFVHCVRIAARVRGHSLKVRHASAQSVGLYIVAGAATNPRRFGQALGSVTGFVTSPLAMSRSAKTTLSSIASCLQWGEVSGICRGAHCAWRRGREAEGGGLLNRYRVVKLYRGFESLRLRQNSPPFAFICDRPVQRQRRSRMFEENPTLTWLDGRRDCHRQ
jgi:hypothetical protein